MRDEAGEGGRERKGIYRAREGGKGYSEHQTLPRVWRLDSMSHSQHISVTVT